MTLSLRVEHWSLWKICEGLWKVIEEGYDTLELTSNSLAVKKIKPYLTANNY